MKTFYVVFLAVVLAGCAPYPDHVLNTQVEVGTKACAAVGSSPAAHHSDKSNVKFHVLCKNKIVIKGHIVDYV